MKTDITYDYTLYHRATNGHIAWVLGIAPEALTYPDHRGDPPEAIQNAVLRAAMRCQDRRRYYAANVLLGDQNWSGSDLQGKAAKWSSSYAKGRRDALRALKAEMPQGWEVFLALVYRPAKGWNRATMTVAPVYVSPNGTTYTEVV